MATSALSYFGNAFPGENQAFDGNLYRLDSIPKYQVGFRAARADGNIYRYSHASGAINRGLIVGPDISAQFMVDSDNIFVCGTAAGVSTYGTLGSRKVQITKASVTLNQYAGGYLVITDDTGEGYTYHIKGNTASASNVVVIELYDKLQVALDATSDAAIIGNMYNNLIACGGANSGDLAPAGITVATTTSSLIYSFVQTWGVGSVVTNSVESAIPTAVGNLITYDAANGTAGNAVQWPAAGAVVGTDTVANISKYPVVGYALDVGDTTGHLAVYITLAP